MSYYVNPHGHQCPWYPYSELLGYPSNNRCEEISCYWISEPINTYSSFAFIIIACALFSLLRKKNHPDLKLFLNLLLLIGVGSALYHVTNTYLSEALTYGLIFTFFGVGILKNFIRQGKINYSQRNKFLIGFSAAFLLTQYIFHLLFIPPQYLIPVGFLLVILSEFMCKKYEKEKVNYQALFASFFLFLIAEVFSYLDLFKVLCDPKNIFFQGHALWHILTAISFGLLFYHFYQIYPESEVEMEIDFDKYKENQAEQEDDDDVKIIPQFDTMVDLEEDEELDENEDQTDTEQIQFNFDEPDDDKKE